MSDFSAFWIKEAIPRGASTWWELVWDNAGLSTLIAVCLLAISAIWQTLRGLPSEPLQQWRENPMAKIRSVFLGGGISVIILMVITFLFCVVFAAPHQLHSEQKTAAIDAGKQVGQLQAELKAEREEFQPKFRARLAYAMVGDSRPGDSYSAIALFIVSLTNTGDQSMAGGWEVTLTLPDRTIIGEIDGINIPTPVFDGGEAMMMMFPEDDLIDQGLEEPIPQGGNITGHMLVGFKGVTPAEVSECLRKNGLSIQFDDTREVRHSVDCDLTFDDEPK